MRFLKDVVLRVITRRHRDIGMDTLPLELCYAILHLLPPPTAWLCRRVCRAWQDYIENIVSKTWLLESQLLMQRHRNSLIFRLHVPGEKGRCGTVSFPHVRREGTFLVYALHHWQLHLASPKPESPYFHPMAYLEYSLERRRATPDYVHELRKSYIHILVTHIADGYHNGPLIPLRSKWHPMVIRGAHMEGFRLSPNEDALLVDYRVLFSSMFSASNQPWAVP